MSALPYTLEYLRLTNRILRTIPGSPRQKALQAQACALRASGRHLKDNAESVTPITESAQGTL